jgi:uncharacterized protein YhbP (UPF0306 family)
MTREFVYEYIRKHRLAVLSCISPQNYPEAALKGIAVSKNLEIIFDTVKQSRKYQNLLQNPMVALVIGWEQETTLQYEGVASLLEAEQSNPFKEIYYEVFPDGRYRSETWTGLVHFKVCPSWIRYSDYKEPTLIEELRC